MTALDPQISAKVADLLERAKWKQKAADIALEEHDIGAAGKYEREYRNLIRRKTVRDGTSPDAP